MASRILRAAPGSFSRCRHPADDLSARSHTRLHAEAERARHKGVGNSVRAKKCTLQRLENGTDVGCDRGKRHPSDVPYRRVYGIPRRRGHRCQSDEKSGALPAAVGAAGVQWNPGTAPRTESGVLRRRLRLGAVDIAGCGPGLSDLWDGAEAEVGAIAELLLPAAMLFG